MDWWRMEWPFSRVRKIYFPEAGFSRKIPENPQKERFLPNFRLRNLKFRARKNAIPHPQPSHTRTRLPPCSKRGCLQTQTNERKRAQTGTKADVMLSEMGPKGRSTRANASKHEQTQHQRITPPFTHRLLWQANSRNGLNPNLSEIYPDGCFAGVLVGGTGICQHFVKVCLKIIIFSST